MNRVSELNQFIERELQHLQKGAERPFKMELSVLLPDVSFFRTQNKSQEEFVHELYQSMGRNGLINFHKYRSKLVV